MLNPNVRQYGKGGINPRESGKPLGKNMLTDKRKDTE